MADDFAEIEAAIRSVILDYMVIGSQAALFLQAERAGQSDTSDLAEDIVARWPMFVSARKTGDELLRPANPWIVHPEPVNVAGAHYASYSDGALSLQPNLMLDAFFDAGLLAKAFAAEVRSIFNQIQPLDFEWLLAAVSCEIRQARQRMIAEGKEPVFWSPYRSVGDWIKLLDTSEKSFQRDRAKKTYAVHPIAQGNNISIRLDTLPEELRGDPHRTGSGQFSAN